MFDKYNKKSTFVLKNFLSMKQLDFDKYDPKVLTVLKYLCFLPFGATNSQLQDISKEYTLDSFIDLKALRSIVAILVEEGVLATANHYSYRFKSLEDADRLMKITKKDFWEIFIQ